MRKYRSSKLESFLAVSLFFGCSIFTSLSFADDLLPGNQYEVVQPMYLMAWYDSLNNKIIGRETARAYLNSALSAEKSWVAFWEEVPVGTVVTIIGPAPKKWYLLLGANKYFVRLDPDLSRGLDVVLKLNRGIEGELNGLNPKLFKLLNSQ